MSTSSFKHKKPHEEKETTVNVFISFITVCQCLYDHLEGFNAV